MKIQEEFLYQVNKSIPFFALLLAFSLSKPKLTYAQEDHPYKAKLNEFSLEAMGSGVIYQARYDRLLELPKSILKLGVGIGGGYYNFEEFSLSTHTFLRIGNKHSGELGIGLTRHSNLSSNGGRIDYYLIPLRMGYTLQALKSKSLVVKIAYTPMWVDEDIGCIFGECPGYYFFPFWGSVSVGYAF